MAKKIIVVGAGIIGASLAYNLARQGADVLILDAQPARGGVATPNSWAWINASWGNPPDYVKLRMRSMQEWRGLAAVNPDLVVNWCGGLLWDLPEVELRDYVNGHRELGYGARLVGRDEVLRIEPTLVDAPQLAVHVSGEGAIEPVRAAGGFLDAAIERGAKLIHGVNVLRLLLEGDRIVGVDTDQGVMKADEVVVAAGAATANLLSSCGLNLAMEAPAGLLVHSEPAPKLLNGMVLSPELHVRQTAEGRLVAGSDFGGTQPGDDPAATADVLFAKVKRLLRGAENLKLDFYSMGYRPTPADGWPAIGRPSGIARLYVAVMHSGITLAAVMGLFGANEIMHDRRDTLLKLYHPDRLLS